MDDFTTVSQQPHFLPPSHSQSIIERVCELLHCPTSLTSTSGFSQSANASIFPLTLSRYHTLDRTEMLLTYIWRCLQCQCAQDSVCVIRVYS